MAFENMKIHFRRTIVVYFGWVSTMMIATNWTNYNLFEWKWIDQKYIWWCSMEVHVSINLHILRFYLWDRIIVLHFVGKYQICLHVCLFGLFLRLLFSLSWKIYYTLREYQCCCLLSGLQYLWQFKYCTNIMIIDCFIIFLSIFLMLF